MAQKQNTNNTETKYEVKELVESIQTHFGTGIVKNDDGKIRYLRQVKGSDGKVDKDRTKLFVRLYIAGDQDRNETANFKDYAISIAKAAVFKEAGVDLGNKLSSPIKIRFTITETYDKEAKTLRVLRELTNVAHKVNGDWEWIIKPKKTTPEAPEQPQMVEVADDDLPF